MTLFKMENYYTLLDVSQDADISLIRSSFRKKAKSCHPDLFQNTTEKELKKQQKMFVRLSQAYETLADPKKRKIFDHQLGKTSKEAQYPNDQKKRRSSSFSSESVNLNKKDRFSKSSTKSTFYESEESIEDLINDVEKIMNQFGIKFRDPLEMLVEWALKIFLEISSYPDGNSNKNESEDRNNFEYNTNTSIHKERFKNVEEELERLKEKIKNRSKHSDEYINKNLGNKVDLELRRIKNKYRI